MRKEDRKPSKRVFPLLQNLDLDTVTFANVQGVGDSITIEDMNEQELQDLVLVNLARLCVSSEWTGLLEAGGGGVVFPKAAGPTNYDQWQITNMPPYYAGGESGEQTWNAAYQMYCPFTAPNSGDVSEMGIKQGGTVPGSTEYLYGAIYSSDADNMPETLLGYASFDISTGGAVYQTSFSATITLEESTLYYFAWSRSATTNAEFYFWTQWPNKSLMSNEPGIARSLFTNLASVSTPPATAPAANTLYSFSQRPIAVTVVIS